MAELGGLHYTINKSGETRVNLTIPFVPYEHFQGTRVYREGFTYFEYLDMIRFIISNEYYRVLNLMERGCGRVLSKKKELPIWSLCTISEQVSSRCYLCGKPYNSHLSRYMCNVIISL